MNNTIKIENLSFAYENNKIFDGLNLSIKEGSWVTIIGPNGGGKSTLAKLIVGTYPYSGTITTNNDKNSIGIVFSSSDLHFVVDSVEKELNMSNKKLRLSPDEFNLRKEKIITTLNLGKMLNMRPNELSHSNKNLVSLASILISEPNVLIIDGTLDSLDYVQRVKVIKILKYYHRRGMTIINITHNIEDTLLGDEIMLIDNGRVVLYDDKDNFYKNEKIIKKYGLELPFIVELSIKLKYYNMVDKIYFDMEELVDAIWK